jgi:uncharacterized membrane protein YfcA
VLEIYLWLCLAALAAGAVNALAGGGTLLTFPPLMNVVASPVLANGTSTVSLLPGSLASAAGYLRELRAVRRWGLLLIWPSLAGGVVGALLVTRLDESIFKALVPWLVLTAAALFAAAPLVQKFRELVPHDRPFRPGAAALLVLFQFLVSVYGGYFGAGIGILMLSGLALMGLADIHQMNALKSLLAVGINGVSAAVFVLEGKVVWEYAPAMAGAAVVGGYLGAHFGRRIPAVFVRWFVIVVGFGLAGYYFLRG